MGGRAGAVRPGGRPSGVVPQSPLAVAGRPRGAGHALRMTRYAVFARDAEFGPDWDGNLYWVLHDYHTDEDLAVRAWDMFDTDGPRHREVAKAELVKLRDDLVHGGARRERALREVGQ